MAERLLNSLKEERGRLGLTQAELADRALDDPDILRFTHIEDRVIEE